MERFGAGGGIIHPSGLKGNETGEGKEQTVDDLAWRGAWHTEIGIPWDRFLRNHGGTMRFRISPCNIDLHPHGQEFSFFEHYHPALGPTGSGEFIRCS